MSADTRSNDELLEAARQGDQAALGVLLERHRERLERMVRLRMDRRLQGRVDAEDIVQEAYLAVLGKFVQYCADSTLPFFLWLRLEVGQKLMQAHRFHLGTQMRDAGQEVSLHHGALPQVSSVSLAEHLLGRLTMPCSTPASWAASSGRRRRPPGCTTRTSSPSSGSASRTGCTTTSCSSSRAWGWTPSWRSCGDYGGLAGHRP